MSADGFRVADAGRVERVLDRMAEEARTLLGERFAVIGILRRGAPLAERLVGRLRAAGADVESGEIRLERYADDLSVVHERTRLEEPDLPFAVEGATILLVDDVLYTGRTLLRAVAHLAAEGAERIACAVLCTRAPHEMPVSAAVTGFRLDVGDEHVVECRVPPYEDELAVDVRRRSAVSESEPDAEEQEDAEQEGGEVE